MELSVVIPAGGIKDAADLDAAIRSVRDHWDAEIVVAADESCSDYYGRVHDDVEVVETDGALSAAKNDAAAEATGDVIAFMDADCRATTAWGDALKSAFEAGEDAAGGPALPLWPAGRRPSWLAKEWDWAFGCGPYHDERKHVRNTYGCNIAFRAEVFRDLGGFDESYGLGAEHRQGEETELCDRLHEEHGSRVLYDPEAAVWHRVYESQLNRLNIWRRAVRQGRAKAAFGVGGSEADLLKRAPELLTRREQALDSAFVYSCVGAGFAAGLLFGGE